MPRQTAAAAISQQYHHHGGFRDGLRAAEGRLDRASSHSLMDGKRTSGIAGRKILMIAAAATINNADKA
jgi:hypothetical protein